MNKILDLTERKIRTKMNLIKNGELEPKNSNIGILFNSLKKLDEPLYDELIFKYKEILKKRNN